uniref:Uncharacterized protein n=1 Tax=Romanomermis culicivorax TaxID=13658 RepID=A0A915J0Y5_ROMCU
MDMAAKWRLSELVQRLFGKFQKAEEDEGQLFKIPILTEHQPRDTSRSRSQHSGHWSHSQPRQQPGVSKLPFTNLAKSRLVLDGAR